MKSSAFIMGFYEIFSILWIDKSGNMIDFVGDAIDTDMLRLSTFVVTYWVRYRTQSNPMQSNRIKSNRIVSEFISSTILNPFFRNQLFPLK